MYIYIYVFNACIPTKTCIYVCMYVCLYVCIYVCIGHTVLAYDEPGGVNGPACEEGRVVEPGRVGLLLRRIHPVVLQNEQPGHVCMYVLRKYDS